MASTECPSYLHQVTVSRHFFAAWQQRNENRQHRWNKDSRPPHTTTPGAIHFTSLHHKIQQLKTEILFALQEAVMEYRDQLEASCDDDDDEESCDSSSSFSSPCSSRTGSYGPETRVSRTHSSASFVRHRVSYPPIARNRSHRVKTSAYHGCQDSYDSGIHNSDIEIFV